MGFNLHLTRKRIYAEINDEGDPCGKKEDPCATAYKKSDECLLEWHMSDSSGATNQYSETSPCLTRFKQSITNWTREEGERNSRHGRADRGRENRKSLWPRPCSSRSSAPLLSFFPTGRPLQMRRRRRRKRSWRTGVGGASGETGSGASSNPAFLISFRIFAEKARTLHPTPRDRDRERF